MEVFKKYERAKALHPDIDEWLAESVRKEFDEDADAILAVTALENSELPWEDPLVFARMVVILNERELLADIIQEINTPEVAYTVYLLKQRYPEDHFNDTVASFIADVITEEGYAIAPKVLSFVQPYIPIQQLTKEQMEVQLAYHNAVEEYIKDREQNG